MTSSEIGQRYHDGEDIVRQGEVGKVLYVILDGHAEVLCDSGGEPVRVARLEKGDFFGEMALFERETRSATVRSVGASRILTVDKRTFMRRVQEDPTLAFRLVETMSHRIRQLDAEVARLKPAANP
jgi:CRP/FNR family cyclic AMP-dependent transcriptional regulator